MIVKKKIPGKRLPKKAVKKKASKKKGGPSLLTFEEAIAKSDEVSGKRHLLLGNGFSIGPIPGHFHLRDAVRPG